MLKKSKNDYTVPILYGMLLLSSLLIFAVGIIEQRNQQDSMLVGLGALAVIITAGLFPIASALASLNRDKTDSSGDGIQEQIELLRSINDRVMISDIAKRIAYREHDRQTLRQAVSEQMRQGHLDLALALAEDMIQTHGYQQEGQYLKLQIMTAKTEQIDKKVLDAITLFEQMLSRREWDHALQEAKKLQGDFGDSPHVQALPQRVAEARESHKKELERKFLEASHRDDVETAMDLLKELDHYLTENEAAPLLEVARGIIGKKRQNLGVQFKMAIADHEWIDALHVGEQIIADFPNTKMADEVHNMLDLLRERAAGQQAAARVQNGF